jgi:hypothetical protein
MSKRNKSCQNKDWLFDQYITQGKSSGKIAEEIGCGASTIQHWLRRHEIPIRDCSSSKLKLSSQILENKDWLYDQYIVQKKSATKIAKEIGCQQETVSRYLHKFEIPIRTQSEEIGGERHPLFGKHFSEESKRKMSIANTGHKSSDETRKKISEATSGINNPRYGATITPEQRQKQSESMKRFYDENPEAKKESQKTMRKNRITRTGPESNLWKGGISFEPYCPKFNKDLKERVRSFFDYECIMCGKTTKENGINLCVHHVEYDKLACCHGKPVHFASLCHRCHSKTNHNRERWEAMMHRIIDEIYNGRSYYTKEEYKKIKLKDIQ